MKILNYIYQDLLNFRIKTNAKYYMIECVKDQRTIKQITIVEI